MVWPLTKPPKFSTPFQGHLTKRRSSHSPVPQNSRPFFRRRPSQNLAWPPAVPKISIPFSGDFTECFKFTQLFKTSNPSHWPNYGSKGTWAFSRQHIVDARIFLEFGIERHAKKKYPDIELHFRITLNFIHKRTTTSRVLLWQIDKLVCPFFSFPFLSFFFLSSHDSPSSNITVICINMYN